MTHDLPARLARVRVDGVAGLPHAELTLSAVTALTGPQGSGKSQLLAAIVWLVQGRPAIGGTRTEHGAPGPRVTAWVETAAGLVPVTRRENGRLHAVAMEDTVAAPLPPLPTCTFLRAQDRMSPRRRPEAGGRIGGRLDRAVGRWTSDAAAAEALLDVVEDCCAEGMTGELLLIEEPELFLTPQAQRYLYRLLRAFAEGGNQVIYSTRSAAFVDAAHHEEIVRLDRQPAGPILRRTASGALSDAERVRLAAEFDHERSEMFFADKVVLVEGQTERIALPAVFRAMGHDPDAEGIAIVEVGGKANLPLAARLLRPLAIPFVVVFDADSGEQAAALDALIAEAAGDAPLVRLVPDFEAVAGLGSHEEKVYRAWRRFSTASADQVPPGLQEIVRRTVSLDE